MFLKKAGKFLWGAAGLATGIIGGGIKAAGTLIDGGTLKDAEKDMDETINEFVDKGQDLGEKEFPGIAKKVGKAVAVVVTVAAAAKAVETLNESSKKKKKKKALSNSKKLNSGWAVTGGAALLGATALNKNKQSVSKIRFVKQVRNLKS